MNRREFIATGTAAVEATYDWHGVNVPVWLEHFVDYWTYRTVFHDGVLGFAVSREHLLDNLHRETVPAAIEEMRRIRDWFGDNYAHAVILPRIRELQIWPIRRRAPPIERLTYPTNLSTQ